jgi:hypothetical protein
MRFFQIPPKSTRTLRKAQSFPKKKKKEGYLKGNDSISVKMVVAIQDASNNPRFHLLNRYEA